MEQRSQARTPRLLPGRRSQINSLQATASVEETQAQLSAGGLSAGGLNTYVGAPTRPRSSARVLLRACRPKQWSKNLLVLAAPCAAGVLAQPRVAVEVLAAFVAFCLLSSTTYLINDVRDREQDRRHPRKRTRPIAAGELSPRSAMWAAGVMGLAGVAIATAVRPELGVLGFGYLALTASYSLWWRRVVVADIVAIAAGFVVRAVAGGVAADVYLSRSFLLVTSWCAVFLVAGKRYAELGDASARSMTRSTLRRYSSGSLRSVLAAAAVLASASYAVWAFTRPEHGAWYEVSMVAFVLWLARYAVLIGRGGGQAPEELILRDRVLLALSVAWALLFLCGVYVGR
jgi:decaprenyl-phosphate phosphoribosyltransferase